MALGELSAGSERLSCSGQASGPSVYGFAKNERDNIRDDELATFKMLAAEILAYDDAAPLQSNLEKAQTVEFFGGRVRCHPSPLQYLGFTFDGRQVPLRSGTLAREWRRLAAAARWAKTRNAMARAGQIEGRMTVHRKSLLTRYSYLGEDNFHTGYAKRAGHVMKTRAIRRQLRRHMIFLEKRLR